MDNENIKIYFDNYLPISSDISDVNIILLKSTLTGEFCIQKIIPIRNLDIYKYLYKNHIPNTPIIYDIKIFDDFFVILCEYIFGSTLTDYINNIFIKKIPFDDKLFYKHMHTLLNIIDKLQKSKLIIHRDIKPDNIMIDKNNDLYLIDFDAAKFYNASENEDTHKIGTEKYAAPEQYGFGASNKSTDLYAYGKIMSDYSSINNDDNLYKKISPIINRLLKVDFRDRYQNILSLRADLFRAEYGFLSLTIPGFRTLNFIHMTIAVAVYITVFYCTIINTYFQNNNINILSFISIMIFIFVFCNYLNILNIVPLANSKNKIIKYLSRFLFALIIPSIIILLYIHL